MPEPEAEPVSAHPLGEGCACVANHEPKTYVPADHHILPQSWGGKKTPGNMVRLCPNAHTSVHRLIDEYVMAKGDPGWEVRKHYNAFIRTLAVTAWNQRPKVPTLTSVHAEH